MKINRVFSLAIILALMLSLGVPFSVAATYGPLTEADITVLNTPVGYTIDVTVDAATDASTALKNLIATVTPTLGYTTVGFFGVSASLDIIPGNIKVNVPGLSNTDSVEIVYLNGSDNVRQTLTPSLIENGSFTFSNNISSLNGGTEYNYGYLLYVKSSSSPDPTPVPGPNWFLGTLGEQNPPVNNNGAISPIIINGQANPNHVNNSTIDLNSITVVNAPPGTKLVATYLTVEQVTALNLQAALNGAQGALISAIELKLVDAQGNAVAPNANTYLQVNTSGITQNDKLTAYHFPESGSLEVLSTSTSNGLTSISLGNSLSPFLFYIEKGVGSGAYISPQTGVCTE